MKVIIKQILEENSRTSKANKPYTLTTFMGEDGKLYKDVYGKFTVGQEIEGEWKQGEYGDKFDVIKQSSGFSKGGFSKSDPNTMLIAYSKDIVVAFINAGKIKEEKEAATQITNFTTLFKGLYDKLSKGENPVKTPENRPQSQTVTANDETPPMPTDEEVNIEDIPDWN